MVNLYLDDIKEIIEKIIAERKHALATISMGSIHYEGKTYLLSCPVCKKIQGISYNDEKDEFYTICECTLPFYQKKEVKKE